jgi:hypothetical protein
MCATSRAAASTALTACGVSEEQLDFVEDEVFLEQENVGAVQNIAGSF